MLESLLWHFGVSPQWGFPGRQGDRIDNIAAVAGMCDYALPRNEFSGGWEYRYGTVINNPETGVRDVDATNCHLRKGSIEAMVRRFSARNVNGNRHTVRQQDLDNPLYGRTTNDFLGWVSAAWSDYSRAILEYEDGLIDIQSNADLAQFTLWVTEATNIWQNGVADHLNRVPAGVYTNARHDGILTIAGLTSNATTNREVLLSEWIQEEARYHWGRGSPVTPYRMYEGGADEHGSMSFSQLLYRARYSNYACTAHGEIGLNLYSPLDQTKSFVIHTASNATTADGLASCEGGFHKSFISGRYQQTFANDNAQFRAAAANVDDLVGYRHADGNIIPVPEQEDEYDLLSKAIAGYNGADGWLSAHSFAKLIKYGRFKANSDRNSNDTGVCHSCRYAIQAKEELFGGNLRTFIWQGGPNGGNEDVNGDGVIANVGELGEVGFIQEINLPGVPWCFAYGEEEWTTYTVNGDGSITYGPTFTVAKEQSERFQNNREREGDEDYRSPCNE